MILVLSSFLEGETTVCVEFQSQSALAAGLVVPGINAEEKHQSADGGEYGTEQTDQIQQNIKDQLLRRCLSFVPQSKRNRLRQ